jgi:integrase
VIDRLPPTIRLLKPGHTDMEFYEEEDFVRLVDGAAAIDERAYIVVLLGGEAGLRSGEMTALEWTDIDFRRTLLNVNRSEWEGQVGTPKGGRSRMVPMTVGLHDALKTHRHLKGPRVLYSDEKSVADGDALASWIRRAESRAGFPITGRLHILRHTFCSRLAMRGATAKAIQELAGHANLSTTQRYMHLSPAAKESAIRLLEFGVGGERGEGGGASEENRR